MKKAQYALWIRWDSGAEDKFEITPWEYGRIGARGLHSQRLDCADGTTVWVNRDKVNCFKVFYKRIPENPMDDDDHYDNPIN